MDVKYRYGHRPGRRRRTRVLIVIIVTLLVAAIAGGVVAYDLYKTRDNNAITEGTSRTIVQTLEGDTDKLRVDEPEFSLELPGDWKEQARANHKDEHSITWRATKAGQDNRMLKLYIDKIPTRKSLNRLLPVTVSGNKLSAGDISDNCATFTQGGTLDAQQAARLSDAPAKYKGVDFICNLPNVIDNEVGTGSSEGLNQVTVKGESEEHKYFFLYTDRNIQPNDTILYNVIRSFTAK